MRKILKLSAAACGVALGLAGCLTTTDKNKENEDVKKVVITVDADKVINRFDRSKLLGINIATYHSPADYRKAINGPLKALDMGLVRIPGGSMADKYYWNGNGVIRDDGTVDKSKFKPFKKQGYWDIDYSAFKPGFSVNDKDWSDIRTGAAMNVKQMQDITREHPVAHNLITVNMGTGTPELAAEWVRWANKTNHYDVKYWELGNELNGEWEAGHITADGTPMTGDKYAKRFVQFVKAMKAVDPTIKVGGPSCDVSHHEDYFTPLLRDAGKYVDFITLHSYSLRSSIAPEKELFKGLDNMKSMIGRLDKLVAKYQPERKGEIEYCISEWNSKLPKDHDAYRLFNGLWFSAWVGEMAKYGVDSATVWDIYSGRDYGHGLLVKHGNDFAPTGRYWAFYLWSHYMGNAIVESSVTGGEGIRVYSTKDKDDLYVMMINESRSTTENAELNIKGFTPAATGDEITLSSREYFWNHYAFNADWNSGPSVAACKTSDKMSVVLPPYSVRIIKLSRTGSSSAAPVESANTGEPELKILLPDSEFCDMAVEGWVRAFKKGTNESYKGELGTVKLSVKGEGTVEPSTLNLASAASRFIFKPAGQPGKVTVVAEGCGDKVERTISLRPVDFTDMIVWNFEKGKIDQPVRTHFKYEIAKVSGTDNTAVKFTFPAGGKDANHLFDVMAYPKSVPKERIGGVVFDLILPESLSVASATGDDKPAAIEAVLQSTGAYWIPCGKVLIDPSKGRKQTFHLKIADNKFLKVMDRGFSVIFLLEGKDLLKGQLYLDNIGFMLRPAKK